VIAQVPPVLESLTGMKLDQLFEKVRGVTGSRPEAPAEVTVVAEPSPARPVKERSGER
jgi:hypothetical protein